MGKWTPPPPIFLQHKYRYIDIAVIETARLALLQFISGPKDIIGQFRTHTPRHAGYWGLICAILNF